MGIVGDHTDHRHPTNRVHPSRAKVEGHDWIPPPRLLAAWHVSGKPLGTDRQGAEQNRELDPY
jgi:hypothetical protein